MNTKPVKSKSSPLTLCCQYTYYTITAFSIRVPVIIKRTLTTMQITQFLVGASCAMLHSFVSYYAPVKSISAEAAESNSTDSANGAVESLRAYLFGSEESVRIASPNGATTTAYVTQPCIVTSGETFAIWLNVLYLAPLTYLFVSFFITSYVKRSNAANKAAGKASTANARRLSNVNVDVALAEKAGWDAARGIEREVYGGERMMRSGSNSPVTEEPPVLEASSKAKPASNGRTTRRRG